METDAVRSLREQLFPLAEVITPNRQEAEVLSGRPIHSREEMLAAARAIAFDCDCSVLLKGGHSDTDADDLLVEADGTETWFAGRRIANPNTHGTGCTLSSAIAANLAKGYSLPQAIARAKGYITAALSAGWTWRWLRPAGSHAGRQGHFYMDERRTGRHSGINRESSTWRIYRMQTYTTQMDAARKGIVTPEMEVVAKKEYRTPKRSGSGSRRGKVAIPRQQAPHLPQPEGVGSMLRHQDQRQPGLSPATARIITSRCRK